MAERTQDAKRPDLATIEVNAPQSYIGGMIYPKLQTTEKTGSIYYRALVSDAAAQSGLSGGTAPTAVQLTQSVLTYSGVRKIKRYAIADEEVKQMGGIAIADKVGAMAAKRSVMRAIEDAQAAKLITTARYNAGTDIGSAIIDGIIAKLDAVSRYSGRSAIVMSTYFYRSLIQETEVKAVLGRFHNGQGLTTEQILSLSPNVIKAMFQGLFAVDEVLIGDDDHWKLTAMEDAAIVCKLPDAEVYSHKLDPVLGKTVQYMPDGQNLFDIESFYDLTNKNNCYDAEAFVDVQEFNAGAALCIKGIGTATTTTTAGG